MMGRQESQKKLFYVGFDLDARVRADHPLRRIREGIDFSFVRDEVVDCYGVKGNVSVDPEVILKMMFLLFYDDVASERELMRIIPERLDYLWFLGYTLDDAIPDHSVLSKARRRWGPEAFERLFVRTVRQCVEAGLVAGSKIHMDGSLVAADASKDSVVKGPPELIGALREAYQREERKLDEREGTQEEGPPGGKDGRANARMVSSTDPDAAMVRQGKGESRPRHKHHRVVDDARPVSTQASHGGELRRRGEQPRLQARALAKALATAHSGPPHRRRAEHPDPPDARLPETTRRRGGACPSGPPCACFFSLSSASPHHCRTPGPPGIAALAASPRLPFEQQTLKAFLRKVKARTIEALIDAIRNALNAITADDARGWFQHIGYGTTQC